MITTIIPTYRRPQLLKRAIESALAQSVPQLQVLVLDNASKDSTEEVVKEYMRKDSRVVYHCHPENIGMLGNYQSGLARVNTEYFSFLSDDDVMFPWFYEEVLKGFEQFPDSAFSAGSSFIMDEKGKIVHVPLDLWSREGRFTPPEGFVEMIAKYPVPSSILFHKKVIDAVSIDTENALTWDCDFLLQIASRFPFYLSKRPCGIFLHHDESYSHAKGFDAWEFALSRMIDRIEGNPHLEAEAKKKAAGLIRQNLKSMNRPFVIRALLHRKFQQAHEHALSFKQNEGWNFNTSLLVTMTTLCLWVPPLLPFFLGVRRVKKWIHQRRYHPYKKYAKWLKT